MTIYYYIVLTIFSVIVYAMIRDMNVIEYINELSKLIKAYFLKVKMYIMLPKVNIFSKWMIERKYYKIAKAMEKELVKKS